MDEGQESLCCTVFNDGTEELIVPKGISALLYPAKHPCTIHPMSAPVCGNLPFTKLALVDLYDNPRTADTTVG